MKLHFAILVLALTFVGCGASAVKLTQFSTVTPTMFSAGGYHACSASSSEVDCWGSNSAGELGDGSQTDRSTPVKVKNLPTPVYEISASYDRSCAVVTTSKAVYCWGRQSRVNNGKWVATQVPARVANVPPGAHDLSVGVKSAMVLDSSGKVYCWGSNGAGECGLGNYKVQPKAVTTKFSNATQVAMSDGYACVIRISGGVQCAGLDHGGDNGDPLNPAGMIVKSTTPKVISGLDTAEQISATGDFAAVLMSNGSVKVFGEGDHGQMANGTRAGISTPVTVSGIPVSSQVVATANHSCSLSEDGSVYCWGRNDHGQMGDNTTGDHLTPTQVPGFTATHLWGSASGHFTFADTLTGVYAWGRNQQGALGEHTTADRSTPTLSLNIS